MPDVLVLPDSFAGRADVLPPAFVCSWTDCGLDTASVHVSIQARQVARRLLVLRGPPNVDRVSTQYPPIVPTARPPTRCRRHRQSQRKASPRASTATACCR